jgi:hypothetical protein
MRHRWPEDTRFTRVVLEVEDNVCAVCGTALHICDLTFRTLFHSTKAILEEPPIEKEDERCTAYFMATTSCFYIHFLLITTSC